MGAFIKQYKEYGLTQPVVANMAFLEKDCLEVAGQYADNVIIPIVQYQVENDNPFIQKFKHKYNSQPTMVNALGYDALNIIMQGITKSDNTPSGVATYVRNLRNYDGAMGKLHFKDGNVVVPIEFKTIINGNIVDYN